MSIGQTFLGLLEASPRHGYELKRVYDERFGQGRPLHYGQVYSTLARLLKSGLVEVDGVEPGAGPERKRYAITEAGVTDVRRWLAQPEKPDAYLQNTLYAKVVLGLLTGRDAADILDVQRAEHLRLMRTLTRRKADGDLADQLICDFALFHLEADLRWLELTAARLDQLAATLSAATPAARTDAAAPQTEASAARAEASVRSGEPTGRGVPA
ncbi:PadR family transcriptional regulator [Plantactinospora sp. ZYX-F-223]|uniref:PadR family transcriptional regulator n=1 Tax=Plantactinospora sp. ZYX-F-223 TaxID=3144103 RepID=UPI0031FD9C98